MQTRKQFWLSVIRGHEPGEVLYSMAFDWLQALKRKDQVRMDMIEDELNYHG